MFGSGEGWVIVPETDIGALGVNPVPGFIVAENGYLPWFCCPINFSQTFYLT